MSERESWHRVGDGLPEAGEETLYLIQIEGEQNPMLAYLDFEVKWREGTTEALVSEMSAGGLVTHWRELPEPPKLSCALGDDCRSYFICGRRHDFPAVEHDSAACNLEYLECVEEHFRHECAHDFASGPWVELPNGGTSSCKCGVTAMDHDMEHSP